MVAKLNAIMLALALGTPTVALAQGGGAPIQERPKVKGNASFVSADKTNIDFGETLIDGKMQAPSGFFLQGRQGQAMTQMVKLRSKFRSELRNSKSAIKALVK